jgi:small subunit ribosomal protein S17
MKLSKEAKEDLQARKINLRGRTHIGRVTSAKAAKTATVEWERRKYLKKYERYEKRKSKVQVHNPEWVKAEEGDVVKIMETKPLSKTKHHMIVEKLGKAVIITGEDTPEKESKKKEAKEEHKAKPAKSGNEE